MRPHNGAIRNPINIGKPVCDYIHANYALIEQLGAENFGYSLWLPRGSAGRPSATSPRLDH
jgi:hypothetical protein